MNELGIKEDWEVEINDLGEEVPSFDALAIGAFGKEARRGIEDSYIPPMQRYLEEVVRYLPKERKEPRPPRMKSLTLMSKRYFGDVFVVGTKWAHSGQYSMFKHSLGEKFLIKYLDPRGEMPICQAKLIGVKASALYRLMNRKLIRFSEMNFPVNSEHLINMLVFKKLTVLSASKARRYVR